MGARASVARRWRSPELKRLRVADQPLRHVDQRWPNANKPAKIATEAGTLFSAGSCAVATGAGRATLNTSAPCRDVNADAGGRASPYGDCEARAACRVPAGAARRRGALLRSPRCSPPAGGLNGACNACVASEPHSMTAYVQRPRRMRCDRWGKAPTIAPFQAAAGCDDVARSTARASKARAQRIAVVSSVGCARLGRLASKEHCNGAAKASLAP